jgi:RNA polymerase sigma-70 factor (ECF subfamily)
MEPAEIERVIEAGRKGFPDLAIDDDQIRPLVKQRLAQSDGESLAADEVYLACACALRDPAAITTFERRYFQVIAPALARMSLTRDQIKEVEQTLRVRLFVAETGELPRVVSYAGDGQLGGLVRVAAVRAGLNLLRDAGKLEHSDDGFEELPQSADTPELSQQKAQHRAAFKAAFEDAIGALEPRDRSLLQLSIVKGHGIDRIAAVYAVHRATAARWLASARENLTKIVHQRLGERLEVPVDELGDLLPLVESRLELSLERLLRSRVSPG